MGRRVAILSAAAAAANVAVTAQNIALNFSNLGQAYEGIGALSGGGGVTRLLVDYDPRVASDILDLLFKPKAGASLQIIKVEIGGDTQSTEGTEMTHEHYRGDLNCSRGYEWWVLQQAKMRNQAIRTYGLAWGVPGWIGNGQYYSQDNLQYHVDWLYCAEEVWGVPIDYMGIWNERGADVGWTKQLRVAMDAAGYQHTRIVSADTSWNDVVPQMAADPDYAAVVDIIGAHYPGAPPSQAFSFNKSLWASEMWDLGKVDDWEGSMQLAADLANQANWGLSSSVLWCLIYSWYAILPFSRTTNTTAGAGHSLLTAAEPWSNHYELNPTLYIMAHWTQFAEPGWNYLAPGAGGGRGSLPGGGMYLTLLNTHTPANVVEFSIVMHTSGAAAAQQVTFNILGLAQGKVLPTVLHAWVTSESLYFAQGSDVSVSANGGFSITLQPNTIVTLTTTTGQGSGVPPGNGGVPAGSTTGPRGPIAPSAPFPFPYADDFNTDTVTGQSYPLQGYARYFSDEGGIFQVMPIPFGFKDASGAEVGSGGQAYYQVVSQVPIAWETNPSPYTLIGNFNNDLQGAPAWRNYTVSVDVAFDGSLGPVPGVLYAAETEPCPSPSSPASAQSFTQVPAPGRGASVFLLQATAYPGMCLGVTGQTLYPGADDIGLVSCASSSREGRLSAVSASAWTMITPGASNGQIQDTNTGMCLDVLSASTAAGTRLITFPCKAANPSPTNQLWTIVPSSAGGTVALATQMDSPSQCATITTVQSTLPHLKLSMRINSYTRNGVPPDGYNLYLYPSTSTGTGGGGGEASGTGSWALFYQQAPLANGTTPIPIVASQFYTLSLTGKGSSITASLNGAPLTSVQHGGSGYGMVAMGCGWHTAWFDNFKVQAA